MTSLLPSHSNCLTAATLLLQRARKQLDVVAAITNERDLPSGGMSLDLRSRLGARHAAGTRPGDPVFPDSIGGYRDPANTRRSLRIALSPVGSTARRELGQTLRILRRQTRLSRKQVAQILGWPQTRLELIETGRIKPGHRLVSGLVKSYGIDLDNTPDLLAQLEEVIQPAESDKLAWIRSHALRKTTATALDEAGQPPAKSPTNSAKPKSPSPKTFTWADKPPTQPPHKP